ncbi:CU044_2847 family protein [Streptomyces sporangiiformans]|uniref:Trypsin-co-occurring domain-containing protein n=1 Tax=Streptomyces sporangiiformans TaxID=2315329 RepID=A0A505D941_9ACTN|nr:CU044_2847 family protein [Streptomyces sporangiiformans]TPQ15936.1 hypothetical protein FGD71_044165 [Streptomyces sporangiiformans]
MSHIQEIELQPGMVVTARVGTPDSYGGDQEDVGFTDAARAKVEQLQELIKGVGTTVLDAARAVGPTEAAITFGVELTAKEGLAVAVLARGEAKASVQVTLTWQFDKQPHQNGAQPAAAQQAVTPQPAAQQAAAPQATGTTAESDAAAADGTPVAHG